MRISHRWFAGWSSAPSTPRRRVVIGNEWLEQRVALSTVAAHAAEVGHIHKLAHHRPLRASVMGPSPALQQAGQQLISDLNALASAERIPVASVPATEAAVTQVISAVRRTPAMGALSAFQQSYSLGMSSGNFDVPVMLSETTSVFTSEGVPGPLSLQFGEGLVAILESRDTNSNASSLINTDLQNLLLGELE